MPRARTLRWVAGRSGRVAIGVLAFGTLTAGGALAFAPAKVAGPRPGGQAVTPQGYRVTPAGNATRLGDLPLASALSPDGSVLVVVNAGQGTQSVQVVDPRTGLLVQTFPYTSPESVFGGAAFSPSGDRVYVSGGGSNVVHVFRVERGRLLESAPLRLPTTAGRPSPFPAGVAVTPDGRRLVVVEELVDAVSTVDIATGRVDTTAVGHLPYGVTVSRDGRHAWVANQGVNTVSEVDLTGMAPVVRKTVTVGTHPNRLLLSPDGGSLFVANGDSDTISVLDAASSTVKRTIDLAPYPGAAVGSNPVAMALSGDGTRLYVANSGNNDVDVVDLATGRSQGMIPTGWYPSSLQVAGGRLWVTSAKGLGAGPNNGPRHPGPYRTSTAEDQYVGSMQAGLLTVVKEPIDQAQLDRWSSQVVGNNGFDERGQVRGGGDGSVIPRRVGQPSPIKHVIYVVKENRTYDQLFGGLGRGNGDPSLELFGDDVAPNARQLARQFTTFDNFYADAEVSANGWNWATAANSNAFAEQQWPQNYSGRGPVYPSENADPAIVPNDNVRDGYLWTRLAKAGKSFRNFGFYVSTTDGVSTATDPVLQSGTKADYPGYDLSCPDSSGTFTPLKDTCGRGRVDSWLADFRNAEDSGDLPAQEFVRLPSDHTAGTRPGAPTPRAYVGDNDLALGRLVDAVSHSRFWDSTLILVTEDDAQNGSDHVDAHRTVALAISPYTQTGRVDSTFYSTSSMLRTMELVQGIAPLTQFDTYATPMSAAFVQQPDVAPYRVLRPKVDFDRLNAAGDPMAAASASQDLTIEDRIDEQAFNTAIWQSVKGAGSPLPATQHHVFRDAAPTD